MFRDDFKELFIKGHELSSVLFYLANLPHLTAGYEGHITDEEVRQGLKMVETDRFSGIDGQPY